MKKALAATRLDPGAVSMHSSAKQNQLLFLLETLGFPSCLLCPI